MVVFNDDRPGVIGAVGSICGRHGINIGTMGVGRCKDQQQAVLAISLDKPPASEVMAEFVKQDFVKSVYVCHFPSA